MPTRRNKRTWGPERLEARMVLDSTLVLNEVMYHPANDGTPEWIELRNELSYDLDVSRWRLSGAVEYPFAEGTIVPAGGYLVVSADPAAMQSVVGFAGALGPWTGSLDNDGEVIRLRNNNDRLMDELDYGDDNRWPVGPDGSGATLAKRRPNTASGTPENWATSALVGGTPGAVNFPDSTQLTVETTLLPIDAAWKYHDAGVDLGTAWQAENYDDSSWSSGAGLFYDETGPLPAAKSTPLAPGRTTYYFRTSFDFSGDLASTALRFDAVVDDGAVYYLNGQEVYRQNMPSGPISFDTPAAAQVGDATYSGKLTIPPGRLRLGANVLAVEVHQGATDRAYAQAVLNSGPTAYWKLDETSASIGAAGDAASAVGPPQDGAQHGTFTGFNPVNLGQNGPRPTDLIGGQPLAGFSPTNLAPNFQGDGDGGNDVVLAPDDGALSFSADRKFTIEAWVNGPAHAVQPYEGGAAIIAKGSGGGGEQYALDMVNGAYRFFLWNGGTPNQPTVIQTAVGPNGTWQHVVCTFDQPQGIMRVYVNGQQVGASAPPATIISTSHEVSIGARQNLNSNSYDLNFNGRIDEVALYDRALTPAEILAHYNAAFDGSVIPGIDASDAVFGVQIIASHTIADLVIDTTTLFPLDTAWKYDDSGTDLGTAWQQPGFSDAAWPAGNGLLYIENATLPGPKNTPLASGRTTYYFRKSFDIVGDPAFVTGLRIQPLIDDGAVFYLNGQEVYRQNMPVGPASYGTTAADAVDNATLPEPITIPTTALISGTNVLAVEVHQRAPEVPGSANLPTVTTGTLRLHLKTDVANVVKDAGNRVSQWNDTAGTADNFNQVSAGLRPLWVDNVLGGKPVLRFDATDRLDVVGTGLNAADMAPFTFFIVTAGTTDPFAAFDSAPSMANPFRFGAFGTPWATPNFAVEIWDRSPALPLTVANAGSIVSARVSRSVGSSRLLEVRSIDASGTTANSALGSTGPVNFTAADIGTINGGANGNFRGDVAEILLYSGKLSDADRDAVETYLRNRFNLPVLPPEAEDIVMGAALTVDRAVPLLAATPLAINEIAASTAATFWLELANHGSQPIDLAGFVVVRDGPLGVPAERVLASQSIPAGGFAALDETALGFDAADGDRLFLYTPGKTAVIDAVTVRSRLRGRSPDGTGSLLFPDVATPDAPNHFATHDEIVISEIMYHARPQTATATQPFAESNEEWIELYNRGAATVDLSGWELTDAVQFTFPPGTLLGSDEYFVLARDSAAFAAAHPGVALGGVFDGSLSDATERIVLRDAAGNLADEVTYVDGGRWSELADGAGASLELRDPDADNARGDAWAASDEAANAAWQTYSYRGPATNRVPGAPTLWREFAFGMLDGAGEVLIDDVSVIEDPDGTAIERIQNGSFDGGSAAHWRMLGNHRLSHVVVDPDNAANHALRVVASGATEYQGNQIETTFGAGATIVEGRTYQISFRAKWLSGSNQINSRLYWDRLARTTVLDVPTASGTPGAVNSRRQSNIGPTYDNLRHSPVVPSAGEPTTISVAAADPDVVASLTLYYSVAGGPFVGAAMVADASGVHRGLIPGQPAGSIVQFYVEGADALGATSQFPAAGPSSRALYKVDDGQAAAAGDLHTFRILMTTADSDLMHLSPNTTSNERLGATIVDQDDAVYYDAGVRLKGSFVGRDVARVGFNISFNPDQLFRGVHDKVAVDRSQTATAISPTEVILEHIANHAGGIPSTYDDLIYVVAPRSAQTSVAHLRMAGFDEMYLDSQYENGADGTVYEFEVPRWATATTVVGDPESVKASANSGNGYVNVDFQNLGDNEEDYRWIWLIANNRTRDDYAQLIAAVKSFSLTGAALDAATQQTLDVDEWMRVFAHNTLGGVRDAYNWDNAHNLRVYVRPEDGKLLALPWDWDNLFSAAPTAPLIGSYNLAKIINLPANLRLFYGHLQDMISTTFNATYMARWTNHFGAVAGRDFSWVQSYIAQRASYVLGQLPAAVDFRVTTASTSVAAPSILVQGNGWVNARTIRVVGRSEPLDVTWTSTTAWQATVQLAPGPNALTFQAFDFQGNPIATPLANSIDVTSTVPRPLIDNLRIDEVMYHPADPTPAELAAQFADADDFEFLELVNIGGASLDLTGATLSGGVTFTFPATLPVTSLAPGARTVLVANRAAFEFRHAAAIAAGEISIAGQYAGQLNNAGERLLLADAPGGTILDFTYDDDIPWHPSTDGAGYSLVIINPAGNPTSWNTAAAWRPSHERGGSPGVRDLMPGDVNADNRVDLIDAAVVQMHLGTVAGATRAEGDLNRDGRVNRIDAALLAQNVGRFYNPPIAPSPSPSPSPPPSRASSSAASVAAIERRTAPIASPGAATLRARRLRPELVDEVVSVANVAVTTPSPFRALRRTL